MESPSYGLNPDKSAIRFMDIVSECIGKNDANLPWKIEKKLDKYHNLRRENKLIGIVRKISGVIIDNWKSILTKAKTTTYNSIEYDSDEETVYVYNPFNNQFQLSCREDGLVDFGGFYYGEKNLEFVTPMNVINLLYGLKQIILRDKFTEFMNNLKQEYISQYEH